MPEFSDLNENRQTLIIYDEVFDELCDSMQMSTFMTFSSRKSNCSTFITAQNPFVKSKVEIKGLGGLQKLLN